MLGKAFFLRDRMTLALYGILVVLALFIVLMVFNPNLSCFGRKLRSPIYPMLRRKKQKRVQTTDYGFNLGGKRKDRSAQGMAKAEKLVAEEYGFDLKESPNKKENQDIKDPDKRTE
jgi:hypothetical protein